jgi:hypothetical protein
MKTLKMMIMPSNNTAGLIHYLAGARPGSVGMLLSPASGFKRPPTYMPYAIDNGAFTGFEPDKFLALLGKIRLLKPPLWVAVPDKVGDCEMTNRLWKQWNHKIKYPLAFVAQDGHEPQDVPKNIFAVFIGGTTDWKKENAQKFRSVCQWLHVGRVNTLRRLKWAAYIGADSIDGTGWFRGKRERIQLYEYIMGIGQSEFNF